MERKKTLEMYRQAQKVMPWGVSSNFRYWGENDTPVIARGQGAHIWDLDENEYIDYRLGFGPIILGHAYPPVVERVSQAIQDGTSFAFTNLWEVRVAEKMKAMCPCVDLVRFANSGTEATMHALRLARAHTGREKFIKFEGHYHGMHDYVLFSTDSADVRAMGHRCSPIPAQTSSGIPRTLRDLVITLPFNDFEMLEKTVKREWFNIAAILFEPIMGNLASIEPKPGYLELIRKLCTDYGIVMIMDEVKTGFRIAPGGAQEVYSVIPDLATYAKSLANGFPLAAFGGKAEVMHTIVPGQVAHAGTYCGNPAGTAAADATLELLQDGKILKAIAERGKRLQRGISEALTRAGIPNLISGPPAMFGIILTNQKGIPDYRAFAKTERAFYEKIAMALVDRGVMPDPDNREPWFLCYSHTDQDIDDTLNRLEDAVRAVMKTTPFKFSAEAISD